MQPSQQTASPAATSGRGLRSGRAQTSAFSIHTSWIPSGLLLVAHLALSAFNDRSLVASVVLAFLTAAAALVCAIVHALAHLVCARALGAALGPSRVYVFGDVTVPGGASRSTRRDAVVALAGPVSSAGLGLAAGIASIVAAGDAADVLRTLAFVNAGLCVFNLLPVLPLDAGRLVASRSRRRARLASFGGRLFGAIAVLAGGWLLLQGPAFVQETAAGLWLVLVGLFVFLGAGWQDYRAASLPSLDGHTVGDWARPFAGRLDAAAPAPATGGPYAVAEGGHLAGVLTEARLREGEPARELMVPWTTDLGMPTDAPVVRALQRLSDDNTAVVIAVDPNGVVRGVLDEGAVREQLRGT